MAGVAGLDYPPAECEIAVADVTHNVPWSPFQKLRVLEAHALRNDFDRHDPYQRGVVAHDACNPQDANLQIRRPRSRREPEPAWEQTHDARRAERAEGRNGPKSGATPGICAPSASRPLT